MAFAFSLFAILHFREVRVEVLEFNSIASGYIVSQIDFDFLDEEATIILKQEAVRDIGKIYQISEKEIRQRRIDFENFLIYNQDWRKYATNSTFEEMYRGVDALEKKLFLIRFTDPRTLQKIRELKMPSSDYLIYTPADLSEEVIFPTQIWESIANLAFPEENFQGGTSDSIIGYFQTKGWMVEEDLNSERSLRRRIQSKVADKYTHLSSGSRINRSGRARYSSPYSYASSHEGRRTAQFVASFDFAWKFADDFTAYRHLCYVF